MLRVDELHAAKSLRREPARRYAIVSDEIVAHRLGAALRQHLVIRSAALGVGMAADQESEPGKAGIAERLAETVEGDTRVVLKNCRIVFEGDIEIDRVLGRGRYTSGRVDRAIQFATRRGRRCWLAASRIKLASDRFRAMALAPKPPPAWRELPARK